MLFSIILMMYVMIQASTACRSTADCPECDKISLVPAQPLLTSEHLDTLYMLSQELANLSCQELEEIVYSTTEPPIQLSDGQMDELRNYYPDFFKNDTGGEAIVENVTQCNKTDTQINSTVINVCSYSIVNQTLHLALDKDGNVVYVPQLTRYGFEQTFQENLCTGNTCVSSLQCQCQNQLSPTNKAVISYINKNKGDRYYVEEIQLRSCSAIV